VAKVKVKNVKVSYGFGKRPHNRNIERAMQKWLSQGYELQSRQEHPAGCLRLWLTMYLARGNTELLFVLREESK
jgi:hypothetical protein